jgi:hypothetical protein
MSISRIIDDVIQYISGAVSRIFSPSDDNYPEIGVQPFEGDSDKKDHSAS